MLTEIPKRHSYRLYKSHQKNDGFIILPPPLNNALLQGKSLTLPYIFDSPKMGDV